MGKYSVTRLARRALSIAVVLVLATLGFALANTPGELLLDPLTAPIILLAMTAIGALVVARRPENPIGWVFCTTGLLNLIALLAQEYAAYSLVTRPGSLPGGLATAWFGSWLSNLAFALLISFTLFLFPTGSPPSRRWQPATWTLAVLLLLSTVSHMFKPGSMGDRYPTFNNPLGIESAAAIFDLLDHVAFLTAILVSLAAVIARFYNARGAERQQLKWFTYAVVLLIASFCADQLIEQAALPWSNLLESLLTDSALIFLMAAIGIAILKYRLYDIDVIIRRTLVYAVLTGVLALFYWGGVAVLQEVLRPITGAGNDLAIVSTTLLIAALFLPLRSAIQSFIDRRFYRRKYDAARTLAAFGQVARDEVDLGTLTARLVGVVEETMQPEQVSLWLRGLHER